MVLSVVQGKKEYICRQQFLLDLLYKSVSCFLRDLSLLTIFVVLNLKSVGVQGLISLLNLWVLKTHLRGLQGTAL